MTEFACVDGESPSLFPKSTQSKSKTVLNRPRSADVIGFTPCTDQGEINTFIKDIVDYFESTPDVYAYAYSNGLGLGDVWPLMDGSALRCVLRSL